MYAFPDIRSHGRKSIYLSTGNLSTGMVGETVESQAKSIFDDNQRVTFYQLLKIFVKIPSRTIVEQVVQWLTPILCQKPFT